VGVWGIYGEDPSRCWRNGEVERTAALPLAAARANDATPTLDAAHAATEAVVDVGTLFVLHAPFLLRVVERLTGPGPHVEDLVQEVFIVAHRRRKELRDGPELRGWLYRVTSNKAMQHRRTLWRRFRLAKAVEVEPMHSTPAVPDEVAARREHGRQIRKAVLDLPFLQREAFVLFELEGLDTKTVAALLDIPEGTVSSRLSAARKLFRERWTRSEGAEGGAR
jgi:RNA polymerase sigma-70 factor, ECF subfamily